ncbi:hypothetical protein CYMTET_27924 [Cymbomonas tetramitiformis]|uniref:2-(3-amino-3-carboxypropyl)histidine synthase subunit 2 n=1 Tax=Cymbomonas tetramitiformis TaxID=36881 RepID=A0AAE0FNS9_9CHLO|nr:hypothetical protein CYMTET_27924 [Cymbomonas tetramitiformis]
MAASQETSSLGERYEIARTVDFVCSRGYTRVALQFPDHLLGEAASVAQAVETACQSKVDSLQQAGQPTPAEAPRFFVLADTTFGSCCVDEVAAAHMNAQCIIHYGPACLSP